jgi:hypothetical protein
LSLLPKLIFFEILKKEVSFWKLFLMRSKLSLSPELLINFRSELLMRLGFVFRFSFFSKRGEERSPLQQINGCVLGLILSPQEKTNLLHLFFPQFGCCKNT